MNVRASVHVCMRECMYACVNACMHVCMCECMYACVIACMMCIFLIFRERTQIDWARKRIEKEAVNHKSGYIRETI